MGSERLFGPKGVPHRLCDKQWSKASKAMNCRGRPLAAERLALPGARNRDCFLRPEQRVLLEGDYDNKRARVPRDCNTETALESKETNSFAANQFPS